MNYDARYNVFPGEPEGHPWFREPLRKHFAGFGTGFRGGAHYNVLVPMHTERGRPYRRLLNARRRRYAMPGAARTLRAALVRLHATHELGNFTRWLRALTKRCGSGNVTEARG